MQVTIKDVMEVQILHEEEFADEDKIQAIIDNLDPDETADQIN